MLRWNGNVTLSQNKIKHFTETVSNLDSNENPIPGKEEVSFYLGTTNIAFSPDIIANSMFDFNLKNFSASFNSQFVGRQYLDNTSYKSRSIDPYFINSLRVGYIFNPKFLKEIGLDISINNLFNTKYETNGNVYSSIIDGERQDYASYFTQAGTNVMARVTLKF